MKIFKRLEMNVKLVTIEGNIGSGKSTMINLLRTKYPEYQILDEPVSQWTALVDDNGKNLLQLYYEDKNRWSYTFQNCALVTRVTLALDAVYKAKATNKPTILISERGVLTDRYVFASMLREKGWLNQLEWNLYLLWFNYFQDVVTSKGVVYIRTEPEVCKERIARRGREGEEGIDMDYLNDLHKYHEDWLNNTSLPVLTIDSNADNLSKIVEFVNSL